VCVLNLSEEKLSLDARCGRMSRALTETESKLAEAKRKDDEMQRKVSVSSDLLKEANSKTDRLESRWYVNVMIYMLYARNRSDI
jgi:hypothetical protein